jgi:indolepyruvate ferredoxin oxidoreductase beta subunit
MEPIESLRYLEYLEERGILITAADPVRNIPDYPELEGIYRRIRALPAFRLVEAADLARNAGSARATNMVMVGAASAYLPVEEENLLAAIEELFSRKGEKVVQTNRSAFQKGREAAASAG